MKWTECSYDRRLRVLHMLVHEKRIPEAILPRIMALLGFDVETLHVYNANGAPGAVVLRDERDEE